ncbi:MULTISPECIES: DUF2867 domain-containing protein [unclassified Streptomyces]|uniref:DUF2867 domain-containing protein n=1 Tax=unclassified Streptomyces TaxID=2593676 RepID=UPI0006FB8E7A|nr:MULTISPECIES: DUF2867 domain-containing protein [unclassified Streptomyces]KQX59390.1 hypothetical protein ASD33_03675 [Streptomyces sp. Root1304]KRB00651.1 hypothetical protein ASE09_03675 [Streptomyces sp. Root66D1]
MRLPVREHTGRPWRIHEFTPDFTTEDVWSYRTPGAGPDDFATALAAITADASLTEPSGPTRFLMAVRWKLGALLGWDDPKAGLGPRVPSLRDRLPEELTETVDPAAGPGPFVPLYELHDECARELANRTVHAVMHLGWVETPDGGHELRMAVLVKPNGRFGRLYMALIAPFRYLIVYPAMTRRREAAWRDRERRPGR